MSSTSIHFAASLVATSLVALSAAALAEPARLSGTVTDVFGTRFVVETATGNVLVDIGPKGADRVVIKRGEKIGIEGDRRANEVRAHRVTMGDGHAYTVDKPGKSWREWLTGNRTPVAKPSFDPAQARNLATGKGYQVSGEPVAMRRHFKVMAAKDGKNYELLVHRDGRIDARPAFGVAEANKLAADNGYKTTAEPVQTRRHFSVAATKDGRPYEVELHPNGRVVARAPFGETEAKQLVATSGYELVGEIRPVDEHFELLGKKDGTVYELHAHVDGKLVRARPVQPGDLRWTQ